jgi:hypothetical protein
MGPNRESFGSGEKKRIEKGKNQKSDSRSGTKKRKNQN